MNDMQSWEITYNGRYTGKVIRVERAGKMTVAMQVKDAGEQIHLQLITEAEARNSEWLEQTMLDIVDSHELNMIPQEAYDMTYGEDRGGIETIALA